MLAIRQITDEFSVNPQIIPGDIAAILDGCRVVKYDRPVVCPGLRLDRGRVEGLEETLGHLFVTSNYRDDLAPCTWHLVEELTAGRAIFTLPPMPIKCAGASGKDQRDGLNETA